MQYFLKIFLSFFLQRHILHASVLFVRDFFVIKPSAYIGKPPRHVFIVFIFSRSEMLLLLSFMQLL